MSNKFVFKFFCKQGPVCSLYLAERQNLYSYDDTLSWLSFTQTFSETSKIHVGLMLSCRTHTKRQHYMQHFCLCP